MLVNIAVLAVALFCSTLNTAQSGAVQAPGFNIAVMLDWTAHAQGSCLQNGKSLCTGSSNFCAEPLSTKNARCPLGPFTTRESCCQVCSANRVAGRSCCKDTDEDDACDAICIVPESSDFTQACKNSPCDAIAMPFCKASSALTVAKGVPAVANFVMMEDGGVTTRNANRFTIYPFMNSIDEIQGSSISSNWTASRTFGQSSLFRKFKNDLFRSVSLKTEKNIVASLSDMIAYSAIDFGYPTDNKNIVILVLEQHFDDNATCGELSAIQHAAFEKNIMIGVILRDELFPQMKLINCLSPFDAVIVRSYSQADISFGMKTMIQIIMKNAVKSD